MLRGFLYLLVVFFAVTNFASGKGNDMVSKTNLSADTQRLRELSAQRALFYNLKPGEEVKEITDQVLESEIVCEKVKRVIKDYKRRVYIFKYLSDGHMIVGFINYAPKQGHKLIVYLRGGNREFAIPHPSDSVTCYKDYTIVGTLYRGGLSEGEDEFGGADVADVKGLVDFIPELSKRLGEDFVSKDKYLLGASRGGMQMFLALSRYPSLQNIFQKAVALSGLHNIEQIAMERHDMRQMFERDFDLTRTNSKEWFAKRNPILAVTNIKKSLPVLVIEGTGDIRQSEMLGRDMVRALGQNGNNVTYRRIKGANHCLLDCEDRMELIVDWLEMSEAA